MRNNCAIRRWRLPVCWWPSWGAGRTGRAEQVITGVCKDFGLRPDKTVVYICGNPDMILNAERILMDRGFPEFHVKKELYWPKGKTATAPVAG